MVARHRVRSTVMGLALAGAAFVVAASAAAQTVRPVIDELKGKKVRGRFELVNDQLTPVNVILEPRSFDVTEDGDPVFRALDSRLHVRLSEMSFRLPAQQARTIFFEATAESVPAWFTIYATFAGMPRRQGVEIEVELPHTVYMLPKQDLGRDDVRVEAAEWDSTAREVRVRLKNESGRLGRVIAVEALGKKEKRQHGSFPLLPGASRRLTIPWDAPQPPARLKVDFGRFSLEDSLRVG